MVCEKAIDPSGRFEMTSTEIYYHKLPDPLQSDGSTGLLLFMTFRTW